ncbi:hypothetical protein E7T06_19990 [Deinococcus sp. Arct2-2]|uniref:hypothetical protein n=1 Tax=Deinococcus sp. Arct2-2 TaxID=2568653 RepID=UPI0010A489D5|nr:hypothetical protein [Deinococcus sp. Arct2-2]THF67642.1 hypothetical protein E7T06_19990 [Deinococcus sp. Arct2-2]
MSSLLNAARALLRPTPPTSRVYRDALIGLGAGGVGTLLMGQYWTRVAPLVAGEHEDESGPPQPDTDVISPLGQTHENGESSTAAMGRHLYTAITHNVPEKGTRQALSEAVHWGTGVLGGAAFGAVLAQRQSPATGLLWGAGLWLLLDETITPLLGLQDGLRAGNIKTHGNRLGAHLAYGLGLGLSAAVLGRTLPK